jgi:hypothetical protein
LHRYDWTEWYPQYAGIAAVLQQSQRFLWRYFLYRKDVKIDFLRFLSGVRAYFGLDALSDRESQFFDNVHWAVAQLLVRDLRLFGLLAVDSVKRGTFISDETIHSFQPTTLGAHLFALALTQQGKGESTVP